MARDESGQTAAEYTGVLLLVAITIAALAGAGIAASMATHMECLVARIGGGSAACATLPQPPEQTNPWDSPDPVTRATWGTYVSLGDSYSAGEGLGDYQPGSHVVKSRCKVKIWHGPCVYHEDPEIVVGCDRSASAYNGTVSGSYRFKGGKRTWACSGAITDDVFDPGDPTCASHGHASGKYGEGCQVARVDADTSLVTMSIGGNDAGFADDLQTCYKNRARLHWSHPCSDAAPDIDEKIAAVGPRLQAVLRAIRARSPHARIIIVTYPRMFPRAPTRNAGCVTVEHVCLTPADQVFFNQEAQKLDDAICSATRAAGVGAECVNALDAFDGCEMGQPDSCLQAPATYISGTSGIGVDPGSFHPSARGQQILGDMIDRRISQP